MARIDKLIADMTLAEKLGQLTMTACGNAVTGPTIADASTEELRSGAIGNLLNLIGHANVRDMQRIAVEESRLKIPLLIGLDVVHGYRTLFPIPLAEAGLFDPKAWELTAREAASEAAAEGISMTFAPMLDVARDARWGRSAEGPGEDPWLAVKIATAKVRGFQGESLGEPSSLAAVAKHYCAYGAVTAGREYASADVSERTVNEVYLPPFAAAVRAGVAAIMPAFTDLNGIPMTAHVPLLRDVLRGQLQFDGVLVSDYNAIAELIHHGIAADRAEAAALALRAGVDIDMMANAYRYGLPEALKRGLIGIELIDAAVRRVLALKERLGLFSDPYARGNTPELDSVVAARRKISRDIGTRSIVMLKNRAMTLPLAHPMTRVALIGPLALAPAEMRGPWWGAADPAGHVSIYEGLRELWPAADVQQAAGVDIEGDDRSGIAIALKACDSAQVIVLCVGEAAIMSGEAASRAHIGLPGIQQELCDAICERAKALGKPLIAVVFSGRPLAIPSLLERADAVLAAWFPGSEAGHAIADLLIGRASPSGRSAVSWPRAVGQVPIFFGERPSGRPAAATDHFTSKYIDVPNEPLVPFGFGLTYGEFALSNLRVTPQSADEQASIEVRVDVANLGRHEAEETVFVFVRDVLASLSRPLLELRGFAKIQLKPGASGSVKVTFPAASLRFLDAQLKPVFEPGDLEVLVGPCADRTRLLSKTIRLI
jgi:beta-glucosidase